MVAGVGAIIVVSRDNSGENDSREQTKADAMEPASSSVPTFGQEGQRRRYVEAVASGKERAISVLEAAIDKAEASKADEALIAQLRARLVQRKHELSDVSPP